MHDMLTWGKEAEMLAASTPVLPLVYVGWGGGHPRFQASEDDTPMCGTQLQQIGHKGEVEESM